MPLKKSNKTIKNVGPTRSTRSKGPAVGVPMGDSATVGRYWRAEAVDSPAVDAPSNLEVVPMTGEPPLTIKIARKKGPPAQQTTMATEAPLPKTLADSESDDILYGPTEPRAPIVFPPKPPSYPTWRDRYRLYIAERPELLETPFAGVSETIQHRLDEAQKAQGDPNAMLETLDQIAYESWFKQRCDVFKERSDVPKDNDMSTTEGSDGGKKYSPDILECVRQITILKARVGESLNTKSGFENNDLEGEPVPAAGHERRKEGEAVTLSSDDEESLREGEGPRYIKRVDLTKEDLHFANDLWDNVINPNCVEFEKKTGKPAEAMREAIAGVITRRVNQRSSWNAWQRLWWKRLPKDHDNADRNELGVQCRKEYKMKRKELGTQEAIDAWTQTLEHDVAELHHLDPQEGIQRVIDIEDELINISSLAARDHVHVLFFVCSVNPYNLRAQAVSGVGVGSEEMRSVLVDNDQLRPLQLMLNDLKTKLGNRELENRKADKLPPAYGSAGMLGLSGSEGRDPPTTFKLFESQNVAGASTAIPRPRSHKLEAVRSRKRPRTNDSADDNGSDHFTPSTDDCLPPLPSNEALARAVSEVTLSMAGWADAHIFKLLVILMEPPPSLDLSVIESLGEYLAQLRARLVNRPENGTRMFATRCCWVLLALCSRSDRVGKRADWGSILRILKESKLRLINWCPSVDFPTHTLQKSRAFFRGIINMLFNPDPAHRLRLVPIAAPITDATPMIVNPVVPGGVWHGCTGSSTIVRVDGSTVSPLSVPRDATSTRLLDAPQGSGISPDDPVQIDIDAPTYQGSGISPNGPFQLSLNSPLYIGPSDPTSILRPGLLPDSAFDPYHPYHPYHSFNVGQRRAPPLPLAKGGRSKPRRVEANANPSGSGRGLFDCPEGMSKSEYRETLKARLAAEEEAGSTAFE